MSKITNLIGTTWRLDGNDGFIRLTAGYGIFFVDCIGDITANYISDGSVLTIPNVSLNKIWVGYSNTPYIHSETDGNIVGDFLFDGGEDVFQFVSQPLANGDSINVVYEFTITGGDDVNNQLFIDFINTYGTLVSGGEPPTAEGVKSKLQSLITASNAKTGKSDANLTDAVKTLLEGYKSGEGSPLPIEISTEAEMTALLSTAEVGSVYKYTGETTDTYENGALYVVEEEAVIITFTIKGESYQAEEGMTWKQWCASTYNTAGYTISTDKIINADGSKEITLTGYTSAEYGGVQSSYYPIRSGASYGLQTIGAAGGAG